MKGYTEVSVSGWGDDGPQYLTITKNEVSPHCKRRCLYQCRMCAYWKNGEGCSEISKVMILEKFQAKRFPLALRIHIAGRFIKNKGLNCVTAGINVRRASEADVVASDDLLVHII